MALKGKELRYAVDLGESGTLRSEEGSALETPEDWTPEHLLLAALVRCTLKSLRHHATRARIEVREARGSARGLVTRREGDGRYALVSAEVSLDVELEPTPGDGERAELLAKAERDCYVGASLAVAPQYRWHVG